MKEWATNFNHFVDNIEKLLAWVRFPCLPIEYYDKEFLMKIRSKIGRPVRIDQVTRLISRGKFSRICVEIDVTKPLLAKFKLRKRVIRIEYEGIHLIFFECGVYGNHKDECPTLNVKENQGETVGPRVLNSSLSLITFDCGSVYNILIYKR